MERKGDSKGVYDMEYLVENVLKKRQRKGKVIL